MKIKLTALVLAILVTALGAAACGGKTETTTNTTTTSNTTANANTANTNAKPAAPANMSTPDGTFRVAYEAAKARDMEAFKKTISKDYMEMLKGIADREKRTVDDIIKEGIARNPVPEKPETRNVEQQEDGSIKMEFMDGNKKWHVTYLIKEGNDWKFTFGPGSDLIESQAAGSGKEGSEGDMKDMQEKKGRGK
ncbi:MAG TPA: hypothetical protein VEQ40_08280 [Pyrinomonadaceae bacterium]|nr:hypothetical protein [Pyrinomonadaceae bacterium]